jgi:aminoglycoside phosphotransferase (APT) family kinase protein
VSEVADVARPLAKWLAERLGASRVDVVELTRAPAGQSNDTMLCEVVADGRSARLVVRRQRSGTTIFRDPDVLREAEVLQGLAGTRVPVPAVLWSEPDPDVLGAPFFVMERVEGRVPVGKPSIHTVGWLPSLTETQCSRLWSSALDVLVAVHDVDWATTHAFLLDGDADAPSLTANLGALVDWYRWSTDGRDYPITDAAVDYLEHEVAIVGAGTPVLLWGDARVGNMIFGADQRVAAALDWETATIGPPERDVAHWLFFDEFSTDAVGIARLPGWPDRDTTLARYEAASGRRLADLRFFDVMDALFMATTLIRQADARVARGVTPADTRMGHDNTVTQMLARRLGLAVPDLSPDYLAHRGTPSATTTS